MRDTALHQAARCAKPSVVAALIEARADVNAKNMVRTREQMSAHSLGSTIPSQAREAIKTLSGLSRSLAPQLHRTPLYYASSSGALEVSKMLLNAGASMDHVRYQTDRLGS
jgi:ankyrin repeat protein